MSPSTPLTTTGVFLRRIIVLSMLLCPALLSAATYTFEGLANGNLVGQDNWFALAGSTSWVITNGTGFDPSKVAQNPNNSGDVHFNGRTNNGNFSFGSLSGATGAIFQFDTKVNFPTADNQNEAFFLGDPNLNVYSSPQIQYGNGQGPQPVVAVRQANFGGAFQAPLPNTVLNGDWISVQLTMDFTANGGTGLGSASFADLTQGTGFQPIAGLQNLPLALTAGDKGAWNSLFLRSDLANQVMIDNLTVAVPEASTVWMFALGGILLSYHLRYRRRRDSRS